MKKILGWIFLILMIVSELPAQIIKGQVFELINKKESPLPGANVYWINTSTGTNTDLNGNFQIGLDNINDRRLIVSFVSYTSDTLEIKGNEPIKVILYSAKTLKEIQVTAEREATMISSVNPLKTEIMTNKELKKAACCNLGESFETNVTVDVTMKDAISGSKEIQVMGLAGGYTQLLTENAPLLNGLSLTYGLNSIPGTQIDAINIVKGPGSVIFGHESISGLVNVELKDPERADNIFVNVYLDNNLRKEINLDKSFRVNENLYSLLSVHAEHQDMRVDENNDGFLDMPMLIGFNVLNKWKWKSKNGWMSQNSVKYLFEDRRGGQTKFNYHSNEADTSAYGQKLITNRVEFYGRTGYIIPTYKFKSIGIQYMVVNHLQSGFYGLRNYEGSQQNLNLRLIYYQEWNKNNSLNFGLSYKYDNIVEKLDTLNVSKNEIYPGIFLENTFQKNRIIAFILGVRADYFQDNVLLSPRANFKYSITENTDVRASVGKGWRTYNPLAENPNILQSSRQIIITGGLKTEEALNYGFNFNHNFRVFYRKGSLGLDLYRTEFSNKIIPDYDSNPMQVIFGNLQGRSFSENVQAELSWKIWKTIELKTAYKFLNVYTRNNGNNIQQPFIPKHRIYGNLFFESFNRRWSASGTMQWYGEKRLPDTDKFPVGLRQPKFSSPYFVFNMLIARNFKRIEWYAGVDNIFDYRQGNPIISADKPYSPYFDTAFIWGPLEGRKIYIGLRLKISK